MHTTMTVVRAVEQQAQGTVVQRIWREGHRARAGEMRTFNAYARRGRQ